MSDPRRDTEPSEDATDLRSSDAPSLGGPRPEGLFEAGHVIQSRYRVINRLGKGGMGDVFRVRDLMLDQEVALKFLPEQLARDPKRLALFQKEVRIARKVTHRNVCRMYDIGEVDGHPFLSMEYVKGEDLSSFLRRVGRLPEERGLQIARHLCAGLSAAHEQGVLHRDLKPANIMIDERGHVRIADFGLASAIGEIEDVGSGTPAYMAPEQLKGLDVSVKSDLFALGLILYELFTGRKAFEAKTPNDLLKAHSDSSIPSPTSAVPELSPETESAILQCLRPDPEDRPVSALAVAAMLPGGDPLGEALAAGRTPSPELVAAAGESRALAPSRAILGLVTALAGFAVVWILRAPSVLINLVPFDKPPEVLIDRAETLLGELGLAELPYSIIGLQADDAYLARLADELPEPTRFDGLATGKPAAIRFWYRTSPEALVPTNRLLARPSMTDPPLSVPGMVRLELDWEGRLKELLVVPPEHAGAGGREKVPWEKLFDMAGLSPDDLVETTPEWNPPVFADARRAWTFEQANWTMRVEAASIAGAPVWFHLSGPWVAPLESIPGDESLLRRILVMVVTLLVFAVLTGGAYLAMHNVKLGRGDRPRALRLALVFFTLNGLVWLLLSEHYTAPDVEVNHVLGGAISSLFPAMLLWLFYMALEPYVRRLWPQGLIGWTRLFSGRYRDPLVGRDVLIGAAFGAIMAIATPLRELAAPSTPDADALLTLMGLRYTAAALINELVSSINNGFLLLLFFVLIWMVVRRAWVALVVLGAILMVMVGVQVETWPFAGFVYLSFLVGMGALVLSRFGLLALITALFVESALRINPLTLELDAWYQTPTLFVLGALTAITFFAFASSRAGEPLFGRPLLPD